MTAKQLDTYSGLALLVAVTQGVVPFVSSIESLHWTPFWALPRQLDSPARWVASVLVIAAAAAAITAFEALKRRGSH